jgi:hypothetical protein
MAISGLVGRSQAKGEEHMSREAMEDGWCGWEYHSPWESSFLCCDCELIHEFDFRVVRYESLDSEVYEVVDDPNLEVQVRLRRRDDISTKKPHQWVGLTDEEVDACYFAARTPFFDIWVFATELEQALKEKNKW